jgi:hypothetical protein
MTYFMLIFISVNGPVTLGTYATYGECALAQMQTKNVPMNNYNCIARTIR